MLVRIVFVLIIWLSFWTSSQAWSIPYEVYDYKTEDMNGFPEIIERDIKRMDGSEYHFSRANCRIPIADDDWDRNESITYDSVSFDTAWAGIKKGDRRLYSILTDSAHYFFIPWDENHMFDHRLVNTEVISYHSAVTHNDFYDGNAAVYARHFYKGPGYLREHDMNAFKLAKHLESLNWEQLSDTYAKDCNLHLNQFFGSANSWFQWWNY